MSEHGTPKPSGWYDDPNDPTLLRYWDGILWSDRTRPKVRPGLSHVGQARPASDPAHPETGEGGMPGRYPMLPAASGTGPGGQWPQQSARDGYPPRPGDPRLHPVVSTLGRPSGIWRRFFAYFIDRLIVTVPVAMAVLPFAHGWIQDVRRYTDSVSSALDAHETIPNIPDSVLTPPLGMSLVLLAVFFVYETVLTARFGATVGKKALGIRVTPVEAGPNEAAQLTYGRAAVRAAVKALPDALGLVVILALFGGILQFAILLWALGNPLRQGLDDRAARSVVRRTS